MLIIIKYVFVGDNQPLGLTADTRSITVDATGDGQMYKVTLHTADSWSMATPVFAHDMKTTAGKRRTYKFSLQKFIPSLRGRPVLVAKLDTASVTGFGFGLSLYTMNGKRNVAPDYKAGPFRLHIHNVKFE